MLEQEYGTCDICGCYDTLFRTYYYYNINCECHSPEHFEIVKTCKKCKPIPPKETKIRMKPISFRSNFSNIQQYYEDKEYYD